MNSSHDMGGMHGFGPVEREANEPAFHARWEGRAFAIGNMAGAALGFSVDQKRHAQERMGNARYLASSYYERWMSALETLAVELGAITPVELADGRLRETDFEPVYKLAAERVEAALRKGRSKRRESDLAPRLRRRPGGAHDQREPDRPYPPAPLRARPGAARPRRVRFPRQPCPGRRRGAPACLRRALRGRKLWGPGSDPALAVHLDLFESYLDPA